MTNENDYEPEILEPYEIAEQPDDIFDDLRNASGMSITDLNNSEGEDDDITSDFLEDSLDTDQCDDYTDCDEEFELLWKQVGYHEEQITKLHNMEHSIGQLVDVHYNFKSKTEERMGILEKTVNKLYEIVHNRKGPMVK